MLLRFHQDSLVGCMMILPRAYYNLTTLFLRLLLLMLLRYSQVVTRMLLGCYQEVTRSLSYIFQDCYQDGTRMLVLLCQGCTQDIERNVLLIVLGCYYDVIAILLGCHRGFQQVVDQSLVDCSRMLLGFDQDITRILIGCLQVFYIRMSLGCYQGFISG